MTIVFHKGVSTQVSLQASPHTSADVSAGDVAGLNKELRTGALGNSKQTQVRFISVDKVRDLSYLAVDHSPSQKGSKAYRV